ncbi:MAG TPA: RNA polymerase sigma factor [Haliangiales bacterium]|nr:RNA polymerase sigma factor [Haliangiales bacterium]
MGPPTVATPSAALPQSLRDEEVVRRVCAGETALFEILMRRYNARLFRVARAVLRNDSEAEDVVQQAYLSAYANMSQFAGRASFATWLTRIALNEAVSRSRRRVRLGEVETAVPDLPARAQPTPEDDASRHELGGLVEAAIDDLPDIYRVVLVMRAVQELDTAETAECLGLTEEAVKVRLHRARALLRESLVQRVDSAILDAFPFGGARCDRIVAGVLAEIS